MKYTTHIVEFYYDDVLKKTVSVVASSTETALIIALIKLINRTTKLLVNKYIMYDVNNNCDYEGEL